jgi:translocation and assembly module TamA
MPLGSACAATVQIEIQGLDEPLKDAARAGLELQEYTDKDVSAAQIRRLFELGKDEIAKALEPWGYYSAETESQLEQPAPGEFRAVFHVRPGEQVHVDSANVQMLGTAAEVPEIREALAAFAPKQGAPLDHTAYENSKAAIEAQLRAAGYFDAELMTHRVEVTRATNSARIDLVWRSGERFRFGEVSFPDVPFSDTFMQRYVPWKSDDYYSADKLMVLQQRLVDADYFAVVSVQPDIEAARGEAVPITVLLTRAKRNIYTAGAYVNTDTGPGGKLGFQRRWLNSRGHKLDTQLDYAQRKEEASATYRIPRPGLVSREYSLGAAYTDEQTDTTVSRLGRIVGKQTRQSLKGFTQTVGLNFLNGNFEVAEEQGESTLLFAEGILSRKKADDLLFPRHGHSQTYTLRFAPSGLLSDTSFVEARADAKWVQGAGSKGRVITRGSLGALTVDDFDDLPPELRFFAGGDRSIRGFDYQEIGETNARGGVIGGKYLMAASAEYEHYFRPNWGAAVFTDVGDAFSDKFNANVGAGIGVRWRSPIGLVRLDIAKSVVTQLDGGLRIHLVIGPDL